MLIGMDYAVRGLCPFAESLIPVPHSPVCPPACCPIRPSAPLPEGILLLVRAQQGCTTRAGTLRRRGHFAV